MSFPNIIYGDFGDEKETFAAKPNSGFMGQLMVLPDGRKFRLAQCGSAAAVTAGCVVAASAGIAGHGNVAASGIAAAVTTTYNLVGATTVHLVCNSAVSVTTDQYADGMLNVQKSAGAAYLYRVKGNTSAASASAFSVTLYPEDGIKEAFAATSTKVSLRKNVFKDVLLFAASAAIGVPVGVTPVPVTASHYFWLARSGPTSVRTAGTVVTDGSPVQNDSTISGSVTANAAASAATNVWDTVPIGMALETCTATDAAIVDLRFE